MINFGFWETLFDEQKMGKQEWLRTLPIDLYLTENPSNSMATIPQQLSNMSYGMDQSFRTAH